METKQAATWLGLHIFGTFFESPIEWAREMKNILPHLKAVPESAGWLYRLQMSDELQAEYEALFNGTDSEIFIPLWASACKTVGPVLLDETTLSVVRFYNQYGYGYKTIDGNPPDFIGNQFQFLEYLYACALHSGDMEFFSAMDRFTQLFLVDTITAVADGIEKFAKAETFLEVSRLMRDFVCSGFCLPFEVSTELAADVLSVFDSYAFYKNGPFPAVSDSAPKIIHTSGINNCGGRCVIDAHEQEGCVLRITSDNTANDPQIRACARGRGYRRTFFNATRLRYPMKRVGKRGEGKFKRITWDEVVDIIAAEWTRIRDSYGAASRFVPMSTGVEAMFRGDQMIKRLLNLDGGYLVGYNSYSSACATYITPYIYGDIFSGNAVDDVLNTKLLILWGHNPAETFFGSQRNYYLTKARELGIRVVVIDPRCSDTAVTYADEWIGIWPSTDSALADGMAYVIWTENLYDRAFIDKFCVGVDESQLPDGIPKLESYEAYLTGKKDGVPKTPEWAAERCGVPAETIIRLAREYATTKPACIMPGLGMQRVGNGEQAVRSVALLTCLTGNVGIRGGGAGGSGIITAHTDEYFPTGDDAYPGKIPHFLWSKAVDRGTEFEPDKDGLLGVDRLDTNIKMLFCIASNTLINQHSNINETVRILQDESKCEFIVCSDIFMTPSAKFADLLLPAAAVFEAENLVAAWGLYGNYVMFNNKIVEPLFGCKIEYEWIRPLAEKLGHLDGFDDGCHTQQDWLRRLYDTIEFKEQELPPYDEFRREGVYRYRNNNHFIAYEQQINDFENHPFGTPSGKIEIFSKQIYDLNDPVNRPAIPKYVACPEGPEDALRRRYPLQLVGWHTKRRAHSIHDNNRWMDEVEPQRLWIAPADAAKRGIKSDDVVEIFNDRGIVRMPAFVTDRIVSGVVGIPQGAWYTPDENGVDTRGSINVLTSTTPTPFAKGNPQHTNLVEVRSI